LFIALFLQLLQPKVAIFNHTQLLLGNLSNLLLLFLPFDNLSDRYFQLSQLFLNDLLLFLSLFLLFLANTDAFLNCLDPQFELPPHFTELLLLRLKLLREQMTAPKVCLIVINRYVHFSGSGKLVFDGF
jgi:hypothetical protein